LTDDLKFYPRLQEKVISESQKRRQIIFDILESERLPIRRADLLELIQRRTGYSNLPKSTLANDIKEDIRLRGHRNLLAAKKTQDLQPFEKSVMQIARSNKKMKKQIAQKQIKAAMSSYKHLMALLDHGWILAENNEKKMQIINAFYDSVRNAAASLKRLNGRSELRSTLISKRAFLYGEVFAELLPGYIPEKRPFDADGFEFSAGASRLQANEIYPENKDFGVPFYMVTAFNRFRQMQLDFVFYSDAQKLRLKIFVSHQPGGKAELDSVEEILPLVDSYRRAAFKAMFADLTDGILITKLPTSRPELRPEADASGTANKFRTGRSELRSPIPKFSDEQLIKAHEKLGRKLGRNPTQPELGQELSVTKQAISLRLKALSEKGTKLESNGPGRLPRFTDEELIEARRKLREELGRNPTQLELAKKLESSSMTVFSRLKTLSKKGIKLETKGVRSELRFAAGKVLKNLAGEELTIKEAKQTSHIIVEVGAERFIQALDEMASQVENSIPDWVQAQVQAMAANFREKLGQESYAIGYQVPKNEQDLEDFIESIQTFGVIKQIVLHKGQKIPSKLAQRLKQLGVQVRMDNWNRPQVFQGRQEAAGAVLTGRAEDLASLSPFIQILNLDKSQLDDTHISKWAIALQTAVALLIARDVNAQNKKKYLQDPSLLLKENQLLFAGFENRMIERDGNNLRVSSVAVLAYVQWAVSRTIESAA